MNLIDKCISYLQDENIPVNLDNVQHFINQLKDEANFLNESIAQYIIDYRNQGFNYSDKLVWCLPGDKKNQFTSQESFLSELQIHPDDYKIKNNFCEKRILSFIKNISKEEITKYKFSYNLRLKNKDNVFVPIIHEFIVLNLCEKKSPVFCFGAFYEILNPKNAEKISFKISNFNQKEGYLTQKEEHYPGHILSSKEIDILKLAKNGGTSQEIANAMFNSTDTIKTHRKNILSKLKLNKFQTAIAYCVECGLI